MIEIGVLLIFPGLFAVGEYLWYTRIVRWYYKPDSFKRIQYEAARNGEKPVRKWVYVAFVIGLIMIVIGVVQNG